LLKQSRTLIKETEEKDKLVSENNESG
jgi:hypothetical protein